MFPPLPRGDNYRCGPPEYKHTASVEYSPKRIRQPAERVGESGTLEEGIMLHGRPLLHKPGGVAEQGMPIFVEAVEVRIERSRLIAVDAQGVTKGFAVGRAGHHHAVGGQHARKFPHDMFRIVRVFEDLGGYHTPEHGVAKRQTVDIGGDA